MYVQPYFCTFDAFLMVWVIAMLVSPLYLPQYMLAQIRPQVKVLIYLLFLDAVLFAVIWHGERYPEEWVGRLHWFFLIYAFLGVANFAILIYLTLCGGSAIFVAPLVLLAIASRNHVLVERVQTAVARLEERHLSAPMTVALWTGFLGVVLVGLIILVKTVFWPIASLR